MIIVNHFKHIRLCLSNHHEYTYIFKRKWPKPPRVLITAWYRSIIHLFTDSEAETRLLLWGPTKKLSH